jgi:flagellar biosynthesis/type III secretory pathway M-ring protein FliF/YscJ
MQLTDPHVTYTAHHWILLAGPAFLPAVIVVGVVLYIAIRDRRRADDDAERSDAKERRITSADDDAERSDAKERRITSADDDGDDARRSDVEKRHLKLVDDDTE